MSVFDKKIEVAPSSKTEATQREDVWPNRIPGFGRADIQMEPTRQSCRAVMSMRRTAHLAS